MTSKSSLCEIEVESRRNKNEIVVDSKRNRLAVEVPAKYRISVSDIEVSGFCMDSKLIPGDVEVNSTSSGSEIDVESA